MDEDSGNSPGTSDENECPVCCLSFTPATTKKRKKNDLVKIICQYCNFVCCLTCIETYMASTALDLHCMNCMKLYSIKMTSEIFPNTFMNTTWKARKSEIFLEYEISLLATETQEIVLYYTNMVELQRNLDMALLAQILPALRNAHLMTMKSDSVLRKTNPDMTKKKALELYMNLKKDRDQLTHTSNSLGKRILQLESGRLIPPFIKINFLDPEKELSLENFENRKKIFACFGLRMNSLTTQSRMRRRRSRFILAEDDPNENEENAEQEAVHKFVHPCGNSECNGFLSMAWKCGTCGMYTCSKCFNFIGLSSSSENQEEDEKEESENTISPNNDAKLKKEHICDKNEFQNAEAIKKAGKRCPKCGIFIIRSSGCATMFCTSCKTGFNWNTLKICNQAIIHNPHFFEYQQRNRDGNFDGCVDDFDNPLLAHQIRDFCLTHFSKDQFTLHGQSKEKKKKYVISVPKILENYKRNLWRKDTKLRELANNADKYMQKMRMMRFQYLLGFIDKNDWSSNIFKVHKDQERDVEFRQILEMNITCANDIFRRFSQRDITPNETFLELKELELYTENSLRECSKIYKFRACPKLRMVDEVFSKYSGYFLNS